MTAPPVEAPRAELELLLTFALDDLASLWPSAGTAEAVRDTLAEQLPQLAQLYGSAAAALGADWYDDLRAAARAPGRFRAVPARLPDPERFGSLAGWGTGPLFQAEPDADTARSKVAGGFQRIVADAHRNTIIGSLASDPAAKGWRRQTTGKSCDFCVLIAGRGAVYSARTADFSAHDDCDCMAVPEFGRAVRVRPYVPSQKFKTVEARAKNNAAVREYLGRPGGPRAGSGRPVEPVAPRDVDADRTVAQLRSTLAQLERSLTLFDSPGTRARVADLRRKIAARS